MAPSVTPKSTHYAIVIDAGSSGSRLQIYSWRDPDLERAEIVAEVQQTAAEARHGHHGGRPGAKLPSAQEGRKWWWPPGYKGKGKEREGELERRALRRLVRVGKGVEGDAWVKRVEPGISSQQPSSIPDYLAPLLTHALQQIPPSQHADTPIYLFATAGMRLLPDSQQEALLSSTCDLLREQYPFKVGKRSHMGPCGEHVRVITGEEEGMWGWVAVNYLMDGFGHAPPPARTISAEGSETTGLLPLAPLAEPPASSEGISVTPVDVAHHSPTFGFLDMGGASTQIAFSPSESELSRSGFPEDELRHVSLRLLSGEEVHWPLFVASWLGYGTNIARERYLEPLISKHASSASPVPDPCLPKDLMVPGSHRNQPDFIGTGDFATCLQSLRPLLDHDAPCPTSHCLFSGQPTPHIDFDREDQRGFIGVSEYWYTTQQVLGLGGVWDWGEWEQGMNKFCAREWSEIEKQVELDKGWEGSQIELSRLQMQCFKGAWISNVLHEGIGIPRLVDKGGNDTLTGGDLGETNVEAERRAREKGLLTQKPKHHFQSMDEVGDTAISWTLGKMVIEASKAVPPRSRAHESIWANRLSLGLIGNGLGQGIDHFEKGLAHVGVQAVWGYMLVALLALTCVYNMFKRSRNGFYSPRRGRKPSMSEYALEEGDLGSKPSSKSTNRTPAGRIRLASLRIANTIRRNLPIGLTHDMRGRSTRHNSLPLTHHHSHPLSGYASQPSSPKGASAFFTPVQSIPLVRQSASTPGSSESGYPLHASASAINLGGSSTPTISTSPPRSKGSRPYRPRTASAHSVLPDSVPSGLLQMAGSGTSGGGAAPAGSAGWNDPPMTMLSPQAHARFMADGSNSLGIVGGLTIGTGERALSRQSSRVNLTESSLAQRNSRAGTPAFDDGA